MPEEHSKMIEISGDQGAYLVALDEIAAVGHDATTLSIILKSGHEIRLHGVAQGWYQKLRAKLQANG